MKKVLYCLLAFFALALAFKLGAYCSSVHSLRAGFRESDTNTDYLREIPMEEMDFFQYVRYLNKPVAGIGYNTTFTAPSPIRYYREESGRKVLAYEIPAGTAFESELTGGAYSLGYGFESFPTYEKGWRWVKPFSDSQDVDRSELPWYYIKTSDLESLLAYVVRNSNSPYWQSSLQHPGMEETQLASAYILKCDHMLYEIGAYISPNLYPAFWTWDSILFVSGFFLSAAGLLLLKCRDHHRKPK